MSRSLRTVPLTLIILDTDRWIPFVSSIRGIVPAAAAGPGRGEGPRAGRRRSTRLNWEYELSSVVNSSCQRGAVVGLRDDGVTGLSKYIGKIKELTVTVSCGSIEWRGTPWTMSYVTSCS